MSSLSERDRYISNLLLIGIVKKNPIPMVDFALEAKRAEDMPATGLSWLCYFRPLGGLPPRRE
jgi:hypothetical protein